MSCLLCCPVSFSFPNFFTEAAIALSAEEAAEAAKTAFVTDNTHNAFQLPGRDDSLPPSHPRNLPMRTRVASMAYDEMNPHGPLYQLYNDDHFAEFVKRVTNQSELYRLADPLGACTVNIFKPGWYHAWHFDESEYTTTLCLQQSEEGGEFEYTPPLRHDQSVEGCSPLVASTINARSDYTCTASVKEGVPVDPPPVRTANFEPGTLQIFGGRYCFHRVKKIPESATKDRLVAVLCFSSQRGVVNSPEVQKMFWGRSSSISKM